MRVFVTGATGFIGTAVIDELHAYGHSVVGLARTREGVKKLSHKGVEVIRGNLEDPHSLKLGVSRADGVIHLAFMHNPSKASLGSLLRILLGGAPSGIINRFIAATTTAEKHALASIGSELRNSGRPFVTTFATMGLADSNYRKSSTTEDDVANARSPGFTRARLEEDVEALASMGVRATMVRLPPSVHGPGDGGLLPEIIKLSRKNKKSVYVGDGNNRWPAVHVHDAAKLFRLALEEGVAGSRYHAVADKGVPFRTIAEKFAKQLQIPVVSETSDKAPKHFGWLAPFVTCDNPCSSEATCSQLGWQPIEPSLLNDLSQDFYYKA